MASSIAVIGYPMGPGRTDFCFLFEFLNFFFSCPYNCLDSLLEKINTFIGGRTTQIALLTFMASFKLHFARLSSSITLLGGLVKVSSFH